MNVLSLFSGVGGFDYGLENAGMKTIYQCEWDKHATRILERHWPTVPRWGDISTLTGKEILSHGTPPDVVAWGSPCQDLSVAGKRAGLEGERSGLFHEGIRIINELRKETNNEYPRISIWENVAGALSSNRGADFGTILDEMAKAGAMVIEWGLLDAQFWIPQRRKRVFVIAIFDPATASNCPNPLLPLSESLRGDTAKGKPKRKSATSETSESVGASGQWAAGSTDDGDILRTSVTSKWSKGSGGPSGSEYYNMVVEDKEIVGALAARDYKGVGSQYVDEGKVIVEPYVKSRRAQSATDDETWVPGEVNPTLNSFDVGDTRATTAIIEEPVLFENSYRDGARIAEDGVTQTLTGKMGTGGGNTPMIAYGIQGTMIGRQDHNGPGGTGVSKEDGPMYTLTKTDVHAVMQYDGYNQRLYQDDVALTIRIGRDSSDFIAQPTEPMMAVRRLTPDECCLLMGWQMEWNKFYSDGTLQADTNRYKQAGNGVASPVAEWIGKQLMKLDEVAQ
jgi:DNA (cytosine-5)-methyltransferase 1